MPMVMPSSVPLLLLSAVASLLMRLPFLTVPELSCVRPPVPKVAEPMSSVPPARSRLPVRLKLPPVRLILPTMSLCASSQ